MVAMTSRRMRGRPAEGAPLVLMEGMSHGLPAVGPNEGGIAEVVGDAGTLVDDRTPEGYARALEPYVDLPEMSREVGERGHERVRRRFTFDGRSSESVRSTKSSIGWDAQPREIPRPRPGRAELGRPPPSARPCARR